MRYVAKRFAFVLILSLATFAMIPVDSFAKGLSPLVPSQSNAFGNSLEQWNVLQTQWALALGLGDPTELSDTIGRVRLLPGNFTSSTPVFNITLVPGTPFVASPFFVFGERYDDPNVPDDDPIDLAAFIADVFSTAEIQIVLDGRVLLEGVGAEMEPFLFGPTYFDEPIVYGVPVSRGPGLNSISALWVVGIGAVYHPLPVGQHTLVYNVQSPVFGSSTQFTYHITVTPK
jgi:hypothetical protein